MRRLLLMSAMAAALSCAVVTDADDEKGGDFLTGTWGGVAVGAIVQDTVVHVHFSCTLGDFPRPGTDSTGRFSVEGSYVLRAYPVMIGPRLPARLTGVVRGNRVTLTVAVNDTVAKRLVVLGPAEARLGESPQLTPCPICVRPPALTSANSH
ncbi:MAG: hypothetical protein ACT4OZ_08765 [Gemmatimonadota bacterium]